MSVKVLVNTIGQQIVAETKQVENKETNDIVGYWVTHPRVVNYNRNEEGDLGVNFVSYCLVSDETEFSIRATDIVAILEPRQQVAEAWVSLVYGENAPTTETTEVNDGTDTANTEATADNTGQPNGPNGDGTTVPSEATDASVGNDETVPETLA
jgi:hypothetical protein